MQRSSVARLLPGWIGDMLVVGLTNENLVCGEGGLATATSHGLSFL